jgi:hypothetical protein
MLTKIKRDAIIAGLLVAGVVGMVAFLTDPFWLAALCTFSAGFGSTAMMLWIQSWR